MKKTFRVLVLGALLSGIAVSASAQDSSATATTEERSEAAATVQAQAQTDEEAVRAGETGQASQEETPATATTQAATTATTAAPAPTTAADSPAQVDETAAAAEEAAPPPPAKKLWRNSIFWFDQSISAYTLAPEGQLTYDPTYSLNFRFMPRFYLTDKLFLRARFDLNVEMTESNFTTTNRQPMFSDIFLDLIAPGLIRFDHFTITAGARLVLPTSLQSIASKTYLGTGAFANISYNFDNIGEGFTLLLDTSFTGFFRGSNVAQSESGYGCSSVDGGSGRVCNQAGGLTSSVYQFTIGPSINFMPIEHLNLFTTYSFMMQQGAPLSDTTIQTSGGPVSVRGDGQTHTRNLQMFYFSIAYDITEWFNLNLYYMTFTTLYNPNGSVRNPLFNYDASIGLTALFTLDQLYDAVVGSGATLTPEQLRRIRNGQAQNNTQMQQRSYF